MSTSGRRSFKVPSAARLSSDEVTPVAISLMVRTEQGATIIPSVRNEPDAMEAPTSPTLWTTSALAFTSAIESSVS